MNQAALTLITQKAHGQRLQRAEELQEIAAEQHVNAPRGGKNLNRYGEPRSAPGEPPATETLELLSRIENGVTDTPDVTTVAVNYTKLEFGNVENGFVVLPRPNGRLAIEALKGQVNGG